MSNKGAMEVHELTDTALMTLAVVLVLNYYEYHFNYFTLKETLFHFSINENRFQAS